MYIYIGHLSQVVKRIVKGVRGYELRSAKKSEFSAALEHHSVLSSQLSPNRSLHTEMSEAPKLTKKQKKAAAFRDRKGKGKVKVQTDEDALDVPVEEAQDLAELADDHLPTTIPPSKAESKGKSSAVVEDATNAAITALQPSKKRKRTEADVALERADQIAQEVQPKGSKRRRQKKAEDSTEGGEKVGEGPSDSTDGRRLILFLGEQHCPVFDYPVHSFSDKGISSIRHRESSSPSISHHAVRLLAPKSSRG